MTAAEFLDRHAPGFSSQQRAAAAAGGGPVLLLAVPGSGKTTVLVTRIACLIATGAALPEEILTVTYTVAAARDMRDRFARLFGGELAGRLAFRTINGLCAAVIRRCERLLGRRAFSLLSDPGAQAALIAGLCREQTGSFASESTVRAIQTAITYVKNRMTAPVLPQDVDLEGVDFPALYRAYEQALRANGQMDYDDQMVYARRLLLRYPEVLDALRSRYRWLCVDEAQDTSRIQHDILELLAGKGGNLFLVGDEDQSIYGFRAAEPSALLHFEEAHPGARVLLMETNYRSTPQIVAAADRFIAANTGRREKHMRASRGDGLPVREHWLPDREAQYREVAALAAQVPGDTAVLYRDNDSALPVIDLLDRRNIPYRCRAGDGLFFSNRVVRDAADIWRLARRPDDGACFLRVYYKFSAGVPRLLARTAAERCNGTGKSILAFLAEEPAGTPWMRGQCRTLVRQMEALLRDDGGRAVRRIAWAMGYRAYLEQRGADTSRLEILEALGAREPSLEALLARLERLERLVRAGGGDRGLILSTIHSSKGLEYDRVVLLDVLDGVFPRQLPGPRPSAAEREALEEERRLFYVAVTRARTELEVYRFRDPAAPSSFAEALFPKAPEPAAADVWQPGTRLVHRVFGPGAVTAREGDVVTVLLDSGQTRRFALRTALAGGNFRPEGVGAETGPCTGGSEPL